MPRRSGDFDWTDERIMELRAIWDTGISASLIAPHFGVSRNAVLGIAHRLNLPSRKHTQSGIGERALHTRNRGAMLRSTKQAEYVPPPSPPDEPAFTGPMNDFPPKGTCRYMKGEPGKEWQMCGAPGHPWCAFHRAVVWAPQKPRKKADRPEGVPGQKRWAA